MSQEQYNNLLSSLLKEKCALTKLREELEGRKGKLCKSYKGFGHLARNYRNRKEEKKGTEIPQNKFEVLRSRVMQCSEAEGVVRSMKMALVKCFRCGDEGHKYRVCPKKEKRVARPKKGKVHQGKRREGRRHTLKREKRSKKNGRGVRGKNEERGRNGTVVQQCHKMQNYGSWDGVVKRP